MSLVAQHLESAGIATVVIGSALDILRYCGAPRFVFTDFPLGNPCGKPRDRAMQRAILDIALTLLEEAVDPGDMRETPFVWDADDQSWRGNYMRVDDSNREQLREMGARRRRQQAAARENGRARSD